MFVTSKDTKMKIMMNMTKTMTSKNVTSKDEMQGQEVDGLDQGLYDSSMGRWWRNCFS